MPIFKVILRVIFKWYRFGAQQTVQGDVDILEFSLTLFYHLLKAHGSIIKPSEKLLVGIVAGMAHIQIHTRRFVSKELKGQVKLARNDCRKIAKRDAASYLQRSFVGSDLNVGVCLHQGRFYDHGAEWHPLERDGVTKLYCIRCRCNVSTNARERHTGFLLYLRCIPSSNTDTCYLIELLNDLLMI